MVMTFSWLLLGNVSIFLLSDTINHNQKFAVQFSYKKFDNWNKGVHLFDETRLGGSACLGQICGKDASL